MEPDIENIIEKETKKQIIDREWLNFRFIAPFITNQTPQFIDKYVQAIYECISKGKTANQTTKEIYGYKSKDGIKHMGYGFNGTKQELETLVHASISYLLRTRKISKNVITPSLNCYKTNRDILSGVMWVSTLDGRTCFFCANLDGKMWDLDGNPIGLNAYELPDVMACPNCRCVLSPIVKHYGDIQDCSDLSKFKVGTRASMNGQVPSSWDYVTWFKHQPDEFQISYLGKERYELWKNNKIYFSQLVDLDGNIRTVEQLMKLAK
jgi:hypothetical protein